MTRPAFAAALSTSASARAAEREALERLTADLAGATPNLVVAFATQHHAAALDELGPRLAAATRARAVIGCSAETVLAGPRSVEGRPALALWAARLPDTAIESFRLGAVPGPDDTVLFTGMPDVGPAPATSMLVLADPFTFPADAFLARMNADHPGVPVVGGLASGAQQPGQGALFTAEGAERSGAVGVVLQGAMGVAPLVSQGCRPVGKPWVITEAHDNLVQKLGGRPAVDVLMETLGDLSQEERHLLQRAPFLGIAVDATKRAFGRADFLARGLLGIQPQERALAVAEHVRRGQTVQFLVRDASSAADDLVHVVGGGAGPADPDEPRGALLFSCNGRGSHMFGTADHDPRVVSDALGGATPLAGFFAAGEIGPIDGQNFLHGFTASVALFRRHAESPR